MPKYRIIYRPNSASERAGLDTEIECDAYRPEGKFVRFVTNGETILTISAADVLQVKDVSSD